MALVQIDSEELDELREIDRRYEALCDLAVGSKMIPPESTIHAWKRDAERYRWLRQQVKDKEAMVRAQALFWMYESRTQFDEAVDEAMKQAPR